MTTRIGVLIFILVLVLTSSCFGSHLGYTVDGVPKGGSLSNEQPGILGAISWGWDSIQWLIDLTGFQMDVPAEVSGFFIMIILVAGFIVVSLFLPGGGG